MRFSSTMVLKTHTDHKELFQPLEGAFQSLGCRVNVPLRDANAAAPCNPHDSEGSGSSFPKPGQSGPGFLIAWAWLDSKGENSVTKFLYLAVLGLFFDSVGQAQTGNPAMVGLPEYSVELSGTSENPIITNHSGKTVIGYVLKFEGKDGRGPAIKVLLMYPRGAGIAPGAQGVSEVGVALHRPGEQTSVDSQSRPLIPGGLPPTTLQMNVEEPIVRVIIDSIVFDDGQFVGPDSAHNFNDFLLMFREFRRIGQQLVTAWSSGIEVDRAPAWKQLIRLSDYMLHGNIHIKADGPVLNMRIAASNLLEERNTVGEESAYELAKYYSSLPILFRGK
jgi:hypothetical protein